MVKTDLIIIGSGPGGYRAADYAARNGLSVIVIENKRAGGTCLNEGCIPTKSLAHDAEEQRLSFEEAMKRKDEVVRQLVTGVEGLLTQPNITVVRGTATFEDKHTVTVNGNKYCADNIIIATGSSPKMPNIEGINSKAVVDSTKLLSLQTCPKSLCIVGAGVIGMEFASIFQSFGCKVTVIEFLKECLTNMDADCAKRLRKILEKRGIDFHMQCGVSRIEGHTVFYTNKKGKEESIDAEAILIATGRKPNINTLGLSAIGVNYDYKGIMADGSMRTNVSNIYAIGDCNGQQMLAHAATFQGFRAVNTILGKDDNIRFEIMPAAVFTLPELAGVGLTAEQAKMKGISFTEKKGFYRANGRAVSMDATEGMVKLIVGDEGLILGCHAYGAHAADMVQEVAALMNMDTSLKQLADIIHIHPTLSEILQDMAR